MKEVRYQILEGDKEVAIVSEKTYKLLIENEAYSKYHYKRID